MQGKETMTAKTERRFQKMLAVLLCLGQAMLYVWSGAYGSLAVIGTGNAVLIILQVSQYLQLRGVTTDFNFYF